MTTDITDEAKQKTLIKKFVNASGETSNVAVGDLIGQRMHSRLNTDKLARSVDRFAQEKNTAKDTLTENPNQ